MLISGDALVMRALLMSWMVQSFLQTVSLAPASSSRVQNRCVSNTLNSSGKVLNKLCISQVTLQIPFRDWERVKSSSHALHWQVSEGCSCCWNTTQGRRRWKEAGSFRDAPIGIHCLLVVQSELPGPLQHSDLHTNLKQNIKEGTVACLGGTQMWWGQMWWNGIRRFCRVKSGFLATVRGKRSHFHVTSSSVWRKL